MKYEWNKEDVVTRWGMQGEADTVESTKQILLNRLSHSNNTVIEALCEAVLELIANEELRTEEELLNNREHIDG